MNKKEALKTLLILLSSLSWFVHARHASSHLTHDKNIVDDDGNSHIHTPKGNVKPHKDICDEPSICVPFVSCPAHVRKDKKIFCKAIGGREGVCCTSGRNLTEKLHEKGRHHVHGLDKGTLNFIAHHSKNEMADLRTKEVHLLNRKNTVLRQGPASYSHIFRNSRAFDAFDLSNVFDVANRALEIAFATKAFKHRQGITNQQLELGMIQQDLRVGPLSESCGRKPFCPPVLEKFRRIDGTCNNLKSSAWGGPFTPYARLLPPSYEDGIWAPRLSANSHEELTSPRLISTTLFPDEDIPNTSFTLLLAQFGQFISHDITQSMDTSFGNGSAISCCQLEGAGALPHEMRHYACMPIEIPNHDKFYSVFNQRCMNFVRSLLAPREDCTLGYAQQMNKITHFIDCSSMYGSTPEQTGELRSFEDGKLIVFDDFGRPLLPLSKDPEACLTMEQGSACFQAGDTRSNQMISLVALHTIFHREHNRVAEALRKLNPHWSDESLFLESRRIVIAEMQTIIYNEWLPAVIGDVAMEEFQLKLAEGSDYSYDYDIHTEPSITNEFATAAFRFGHSAVDGLLKLYGPKKMEEIISIPEIMFHPARLRKRLFLDEILSTLTTEPIQEVDHSFTEGLTRYMFRGGNPFGVDLAALNIQRGRDHGLRPYNDYRELTGQQRIKSFEEFRPDMAEKLSKVYESVDDLDLWVGGLLEPKAPGSLVGYTFRDIIADQFVRLKKGDKYFFENDPSINPGYFVPNQLREVRKATMARIICDNSDNIILARQAPNAFRQPGVPGNEYVDCDGTSIPRVDLRYWKH